MFSLRMEKIEHVAVVYSTYFLYNVFFDDGKEHLNNGSLKGLYASTLLVIIIELNLVATFLLVGQAGMAPVTERGTIRRIRRLHCTKIVPLVHKGTDRLGGHNPNCCVGTK
jgi:hypothetical protein